MPILFLRHEILEAVLLTRGSGAQPAARRFPAGEFRMRPDQRKLLGGAGELNLLRHALEKFFDRSKRAALPRTLRHPRRMLEHSAQQHDEARLIE